jgi:hypothetical protein
VQRLKAGALTMRALVRMKVADDMDLVAARQALNTTSAFFSALEARSARLAQSLFATIQSLQWPRLVDSVVRAALLLFSLSCVVNLQQRIFMVLCAFLWMSCGGLPSFFHRFGTRFVFVFTHRKNNCAKTTRSILDARGSIVQAINHCEHVIFRFSEQHGTFQCGSQCFRHCRFIRQVTIALRFREFHGIVTR